MTATPRPGPVPGTRPVAVLVGPPGAGKSTVARGLADLLGVTVRDTDHDVEVAAGKPIRDIFVDDGEPTFRTRERAAVARALVEHRGVLALGGGAVMDPLTEADLLAYAERGGTVVFLDVSLAQAAPRVGFNTSRPLLMGNPRAQWQSLMDRRRPVYERVATLVVSTDGRTAAQAAREVADHLAEHLTDQLAAASATSDEAASSSSSTPSSSEASSAEPRQDPATPTPAPAPAPEGEAR
ncbi:shikimate kinase [Cellulomonas sp. ATA003]|uniref:shikimate kinase n=1 Tax=Cellulomonas sp. ATA003 TaxID=3073064 RepID=UPI002873EF29|nr:shikimate kinase [Cellulomonas sp. ATA003]WNB87386.1 shikimate kinase [Cellulomonas sp. ATA003]